jgi:coenzyme F420-reducing hydrogenase beta subunit
MWGTGLFKSNACDFCDDVTTELADVSLDAWIPYNKDGLGNSVANFSEVRWLKV